MIGGREFDFAGHEYLKGIYLEEGPAVVIRKAAQMGASEYGISRAMHFAATNANIVSNTITRTWDTVPPTITSITPADASPTKAASVTFNVTFSENVLGVGAGNFTLTTTGTIAGTSWTVVVGTGSGDGTIRLDLADPSGITDAAGNVAPAFSAGGAYTIDRTAPAAPSIDSHPNLYSPSAAATFFFTDQGDVLAGGVSSGTARLECSIDGGPFATCVSPASYASLADGPHTFAVHAVDNVGNVGSDTSFAWTVDTHVPTVSIATGPTGIVNSTTATFTIKDFS